MAGQATAGVDLAELLRSKGFGSGANALTADSAPGVPSPEAGMIDQGPPLAPSPAPFQGPDIGLPEARAGGIFNPEQTKGLPSGPLGRGNAEESSVLAGALAGGGGGSEFRAPTATSQPMDGPSAFKPRIRQSLRGISGGKGFGAPAPATPGMGGPGTSEDDLMKLLASLGGGM